MEPAKMILLILQKRNSIEQIEEAIKAGFKRVKTHMEELGMKELYFKKNKKWEFVFGDVGEFIRLL